MCRKKRENDFYVDMYEDILSDVLVESYDKNPKYQDEYGSWANWFVPESNYNILIFNSGWAMGFIRAILVTMKKIPFVVYT